MKKIAIVAIPIVFLWACVQNNTGNDPNPDNNATNRKALLTNVADNIIIPSYSSFKLKLDTLVLTSNAFTTTPTTTTLSDFRQAWTKAYVEWQKVEMFEVGPAETHALRNYLNIYPANVTVIQQNIANSSASLDLPAAYPSQGFPAMDYLINGLATSDTAIVSYYTTATDASARIAYLKKITDKMTSVFTSVYTEWNNGYRDQFISKTSLDAGSSTSLLLNAYVQNFERYIRAGKFGIPSGVMISTGTTTYPEKVEAYYKKDISLTLAKTAHQASVDFFNGKNKITGLEGSSLKTYLNGLGAKDSKSGTVLSDAINSQFAVTDGKLNLLSNNLYQQVISNNQAMIDVYNEMQKTTRMLKVDMTSAMSITITYTDNDGD